MRYIFLFLFICSNLAGQTKWRQIERTMTKFQIPAGFDKIPGIDGYACKYINFSDYLDSINFSIAAGNIGSGPNGSVAYWSQDTLAGDTVHYWDKNNKRLGLNTKTPQSLLHVKKNEFALPVAEFDNPGTNGQTVVIKHGASSDGRYPLKIQTPAATSYFDARGYMGLGITPSYPIHVYNSSGISRFENPGANGDAGFDLKNGNKQWRIAMNAEGGSTNNVHFRDVTGNRYPITLQSSDGYVGLLNLTPGRELDVNGRVRISTLDTDNAAPSTNGTTKMVITDASGDLSYANIPTGGSTIDSTIIIGGYGITSVESPANTFNIVADTTQMQRRIVLSTNGTSGPATLTGSRFLNIPQYQAQLTNPVIGTGTINYVPKFTASSQLGNSLIQDNGTNVGIGGLNTSFRFFVNQGDMKIGNTAGTFNKLYFGDGAGAWIGEHNNDNRLYVKGSSLSIESNGTTGASGNVLTADGVGNATWSAPAATNLTLSGTTSPYTIAANGTGVTISQGSGVTLTKTSNNLEIAATGPQTWADMTTHILAWNSTGTFNSAKNVGISAQPTRDLDVNGDVRFRGAIYDSNDSPGTSGQYLKTNGSGAFTWSTLPSSIIFSGTSTPGLVPGSSGGSTNFLRADGAWAAPPIGLTGSGTAGHVPYFTNTTIQSSSINFKWENANNRLVLGNPTTSSHTLDVNGSVRFRNLIYDSGNSAGSTGQYLTSNGIGAWFWSTDLNQSFAQMQRQTGASTAITTTLTTISFDSGDQNGTLTYDATTERITVTQTGTYSIELSINLNGTSNRRVGIEMYRNNTGGQNFALAQDVNNQYEYVTIKKIVTLLANDYIDFRISYDNTSGTGTDINYYRPIFSATRIK